MKVSRAALIETDRNKKIRKGIAMRHISIDFISQNDIRISIDGEKITDITGVLLEIKVNDTERYCIEKNAPPKQEKATSYAMVENWRTIPEAIRDLKAEDPKTAITDCSVRDLVKKGEIASIKSGSITKINLTELKEFFRNNSKIKQTIKPSKARMEAIF